MESVVFEGKEYIKASVLAEKFRYTQDYLGQLCRGKKVDARLVGRAWYVNLASLEDHRSGRYKAASKGENSAEISTKKPSNNFLSRIDVEPVLKNKTVKIFREKNGELSEVPVRYEKDEYSLIPKVNKSAASVDIPILPAGAEKLKIKTPEKRFNIIDFKADDLPEVYLSGRIDIEGIPEATESDEINDLETSKATDISSNIKTELQNGTSRIVSIRQPKRKTLTTERSDIKRIVQIKNRPILIKKQPEEAAIKQIESLKIQQQKQVVSSRQIAHHETVISRSQQSLDIKRPASFSPDIVLAKTAQRAESKTTSGSFFYVGVFIFLVAAVVSFLVLVTVREVTVQDGFYTDKLTFDFEILKTLFETIFK